MEALQKVLLGLPPAEALQCWPDCSADKSIDALEALRALPDTADEVERLLIESHLPQRVADLAAQRTTECGSLALLELLITRQGPRLSEPAINTVTEFLLTYPFQSSKVRPKKKYSAFLREAERQNLAFGKKQAMRYYLLSQLLSHVLSLPKRLSIPKGAVSEAVTLGLFLLKYWQNPIGAIECCPNVNRSVQWVEAVLLSTTTEEIATERLCALQSLLEEHIRRAEAVQTLHSVCSLPAFSHPAAPTPLYSKCSV